MNRANAHALAGLASAVALLGSCTTWRAGRVSETPSAGRTGHLLLLTADRAIELDQAHAEGDAIRGELLAAWTLPAGGLDARAAEEVEQSGDDPAELAARLGWQPTALAAPHEVKSIPASEVRSIRFVATNTKAVGWTFVGVLAAAGAVIVILFFSVAGRGGQTGRPLRVRGRVVLTPVQRGGRSDWSAPVALQPVPEPLRARLAELWTRDARGEHASVAAFHRIALELMSLGAPPDLLARVGRAALDELEHAKVCFAVASAFHGEAVEPGPLPEALAPAAPDLERLAREALLDGFVGEGLAAAALAIGAQRASDPALARVLSTLAADERRHAQLSWDIAVWAAERGGERVWHALREAVEEARLPECDEAPEAGRCGRADLAPHLERLQGEARVRLRRAAGVCCAACSREPSSARRAQTQARG